MQLIKAEQRGHRVLTLWDDGVADEFPTIWLLHACTCEKCGLSIKGVRQQRLTDYSARPVITVMSVQGDTLHIAWEVNTNQLIQESGYEVIVFQSVDKYHTFGELI